MGSPKGRSASAFPEAAVAPTAVISVAAIARNQVRFGPTTSLPIMKGCKLPHATLQRKRKAPPRSATNVAARPARFGLGR